MSSRRSSFYVMLYVLCAMLSSCGYTTKAVLPDNVKTIHVEIFRNDIDITKEVSAEDKYEVYRPNLEIDLRDAIIERIFLDGYLKLTDRDRADAILEGEIVHYRKDPLRYQDRDVREFKISLVCDIRLYGSDPSDLIWEEIDMIGDTTFFTSGSLSKSETAALDDAISDLARRIVNRIVENW